MSQKESMVMAEELSVDTDVHLHPTHEDLKPYLKKQYKNRPDRYQSPRDGWDRTIGGKIEQDLARTGTPEAIKDNLCDDLHVDHAILNTFGAISMFPDVDYAADLMKAHNNWLIDNFLDEHDEFKGLGTIATQRPDIAAEEIDRLGNEDDIVGLYIHNTGPNPPLGDPSYDIMYRAAEDNNLNVLFHGSANGATYEFPRQNQSFNKFLEVHVLSHPWSHMMTLTSLIVEGTVEKFPDLEFGFLEAGLSWVPYMMFRLNKEYAMRRSEAPLLEKSPEEYIREKMYFASQPLGEPNNPNHFDLVMELVGTDSILFATDYPHWDFDAPEALDKHLRSVFDQEERTAVLSENANSLLGLNL